MSSKRQIIKLSNLQMIKFSNFQKSLLRFLKFITILVPCSLLLVLTLMAFRTSEEVTGLTIETNKAPEIELVSLSGKKIKLSKLRGKMVLIDFWASWCGPCRRENPNVVEAYGKYKDKKFLNGKGFEVFSVSLDKNEDAWKKAVAEDKLSWKNHGWDKNGEVAKLYEVNSIPSGFLVDGDGNIVAKGQDIRGMGLHLALDKLLKK